MGVTPSGDWRRGAGPAWRRDREEGATEAAVASYCAPVNTCCDAEDPKPSAALRFCPPETKLLPRPIAVPPRVTTCWSACENAPTARLELKPPRVTERPWPEATPPTVATDWVASLAKPRAVFMLLPPLVMTRPRPEATPPMVVTSCPA